MGFKEFGEIFREKLTVFCSVVISFLTPIKPLLIIVGLIIFVDTITGIYKVYKTKENFSSRKLSRTVSKMVLYLGSIILVFILDKYLLGEIVKIFTTVDLFPTKAWTMFLVGVELLSIRENIKAATKLDIWEKFKSILRRAKEEKDEIQNF